MVKMVKDILLFTATLILLLHSIVPHHHSYNPTETQICEHQEESSIIEFFELIFGEDLGEKHLEYFKAESNSTAGHQFQMVAIVAVLFQNFPIYFEPKAKETIYLPLLGKLLPKHCFTKIGRAPPAY